MKFIEAAPFSRQRPSLMTDEELNALMAHLEEHPQSGDAIPGTGGFRKIRWANSQRNKGKRSGSRTIYLLVSLVDTIHFFAIYDHAEKDDLTAAEKRELAAIARELKDLAKGERRTP